MVGTEIASFPDEVKRMEKLGCELGNHTYDHTDLTSLSPEDISSEIAQVDERLVNLTGEGASVVRPPYGSVNDTVKTVVFVLQFDPVFHRAEISAEIKGPRRLYRA